MAAESPRAHDPGSEGGHVSEPLAPLDSPFQIRRECLACRGAAAVFDMSYFGKFYLVGEDARKAADWLFSADVSRPSGTRPGRRAEPLAQLWAPQRGGISGFLQHTLCP